MNRNGVKKRECSPAPAYLVPLLHQGLHGAEQGAITSHRHQDLLQRVDGSLTHLPVDLGQGVDQQRVTLDKTYFIHIFNIISIDIV